MRTRRLPAVSVLWNGWPAAQTASPVFTVQPVNGLYSFVRVFETFELTLILQGRSEHNSHMNDVLTLSFKLRSRSLSTIADMYMSSLVSQSGNQSERIQGFIHWASLSVLLMPVENYNFHLKITLFINTLTLALIILHATVLYFKYNVNISKCWPSHLYLCSFWTLGRGAGMWGRKE